MIQMESFTRECLQIDSEAHRTGDPSTMFAGGTMERIYSRAANLVKKTLDVEGAYVMDVSRSGLHEVTDSSEGRISITLYGTGDAELTGSRVLPIENYSEVVDFFIKHPDGIAAEGHMPHWFGDLIPREILHALSVSTIKIYRPSLTHSTSLVVPIFNIDQRPFAVLVAYNTVAVSKPFVSFLQMYFTI